MVLLISTNIRLYYKEAQYQHVLINHKLHLLA